MAAPNPLDVGLVIVFAVTVVTALVARWTRLPITALEIVAGIVLVATLGFNLPVGAQSILDLGGLFIVFLAGFETGFGFLRRRWKEAFTVGLPGFLGPFVGLAVVLYYGVHAPLLTSILGATVLADTSISVTYTTLRQFDLAELPFGRLVLASTLVVNLVEDSTVTATSFLNAPGLLFTLAMLGALAAAAYLLPRISRAAEGKEENEFTNISARSLVLSLAVLALLSSMVGVPGILFVFLMGLALAQLLRSDALGRYLANVRGLAFGVFVPLYFVAVGLKVDPAFLLAHWPIVAGLVGVASALKIGSLYPSVRAVFGKARAGPITVLMNARLTSATVILALTLGQGLISEGWYSVFLCGVAVLALASSGALRAFPAFASVTTARALFGAGTDAEAEPPEPSPMPLPGPVRGGPG